MTEAPDHRKHGKPHAGEEHGNSHIRHRITVFFGDRWGKFAGYDANWHAAQFAESYI